jgi:hypothetical protein
MAHYDVNCGTIWRSLSLAEFAQRTGYGPVTCRESRTGSARPLKRWRVRAMLFSRAPGLVHRLVRRVAYVVRGATGIPVMGGDRGQGGDGQLA